jgi:hypothetical protein
MSDMFSVDRLLEAPVAYAHMFEPVLDEGDDEGISDDDDDDLFVLTQEIPSAGTRSHTNVSHA